MPPEEPKADGAFTSRPQVAALEAGRLLQRFTFHIQQAWFFGGEHQAAAEVTAGGLAFAARGAVLVARRDELEKAVRRIASGLLEVAESEPQAEALALCNEDLVAGFPHTDSSSARAELLEQVFWEVANIRGAIVGMLDDQAKLALRLGELIEGGMCRPDIYLFLWEDKSGDSNQNLLANSPRRPGEVLPDGNWLETVRHLCGELGLPSDLSPDLIQQAQSVTQDTIQQVVASIDHQARAAIARWVLIQAEASSPAVLIPRWNKKARELWLGDRLLKRFSRNPAPNQERLLDAFQEEEWAPCIYDPLDPDKLAQTLKDINHSLPEGTLHFRKDGTGESVCWEERKKP